MRSRTRIYPTVAALESRQLLSSLPVVASTAEIHVEKGNGKGKPVTSSPGTIAGTATFLLAPVGDSPVPHVILHCDFAIGRGSVKPFGRVSLVVRGRFSSEIGALEQIPPQEGLAGSPDGVINLANAKGRAVGSIEVDGGSWGQFTYRLRKTAFPAGSLLHGRVAATGTGSFSFPEGEPVVSENTPGVPVPFTITL